MNSDQLTQATQVGPGNPVETQQIVSELVELLADYPDLKVALETSIRKAALPDVTTLAQYYAFLNGMVTLIPTDRNLNPYLLKFYYLMSLAPQNRLMTDDLFQGWACKFAETGVPFLIHPLQQPVFRVF